MGWMRVVGCEKLQCYFVARTFAFITPVQYVLQQDSCSYETIPNGRKHYETHQNMSLGSNGVDQVIRCENYNVTSWHEQVSCSYETIPNAPKHYETQKNEFSV